VGYARVVPADKVATVLGQENPARRGRFGQHRVIVNPSAGSPRLLHGQHVVAQPAQRFDNGVAKVLVGVEMGQGLSDLVLVSLGSDLRAVRLRIGPSVDEVLGSQIRIVEQKLGLARPQIARLDKLPNGNPSPGDPSGASANALGLLDPFHNPRIKDCNPVRRELLLESVDLGLWNSDDLSDELRPLTLGQKKQRFRSLATCRLRRTFHQVFKMF
jgi:hypothetical protein